MNWSIRPVFSNIIAESQSFESQVFLGYLFSIIVKSGDEWTVITRLRKFLYIYTIINTKVLWSYWTRIQFGVREGLNKYFDYSFNLSSIQSETFRQTISIPKLRLSQVFSIWIKFGLKFQYPNFVILYNNIYLFFHIFKKKELNYIM